MTAASRPTDIEGYRRALADWLDERAGELAPPFDGHGTLDDQVAQFRRIRRVLFDEGWGRYGWPEVVGGLGGPPILRAVLGEEVMARDLVDASTWSMIEVLGPTVVTFGRPELVAEMLPKVLRGDEMWCQGFSEPGAGSDLASLSCKATAVDGGFSITGQKLWTSYVQYSERCVLLTRTGEPGSAHRGITAFFVDVDSPGLTYRPLEIENGRLEFAEVFYDDVFVPADRVLGTVNGGWQIAMDVLPYERSTCFWHRGAYLHRRMGQLVDRMTQATDGGASAAGALGEAFQNLFAFRCRSRATQHRLASGQQLGPETSLDKMMVAWAEQGLFDTVRDLLPGVIELDDDPMAELWRNEFLYSRAATIYGGTAEVQRNIVARRLLDLGAEA